MERDGTKHLILGALLFGIGCLLFSAGSRGSALAVGWIVCGAVGIGYGIFRRVNLKLSPPPLDPFRNAPNVFRILMRAMIAAAERSGKLSSEALQGMHSIFLQITDNDYDVAVIKQACAAHWGDSEELLGDISRLHVSKVLSPEAGLAVLQASALILATKGDLDPDDKDHLLYLSRNLELPDAELRSNISSPITFKMLPPQPLSPLQPQPDPEPDPVHRSEGEKYL